MTTPHRTPTSGSEVVHIVETAFAAVRAERDDARAVLRRIADAPFRSRPNPDGTFSVDLPADLFGEIARHAYPPI